ncbi:MAG: EamA family transporter [Alphaproteobacteria bacterium]
MSLRDVALATLVMLIWGVNFAVAKTGLMELPPLLMMTVRFTLVAAVLVPFVRRPAIPLGQLVGVSVTLGFLHFGLFFSGLNGTDAAAAAIVLQIQVPFAVIVAAILHEDRPGWRRILGICIAFTGVALVLGRPEVESRFLSLLLILGAALVWAVANFQIKAMGEVDGFALNGWIALFAVPQLAVASLVLEDGQLAALASAGWRGYGAVLYMALLATMVAYGLWYTLIRRYPMSLVMPFTLLAPVIGVASGIVLLGEALSWHILLGGAATVAGVALIVLSRPQLVEPEAEAGGGP